MRSSALAAILVLIGSTTMSFAAVLISPQEAQLPPARTHGIEAPVGADRGGVTRDPDVIVQSPRSAVGSPFPLRITFQAHNGARVDPASVNVTLLTNPSVDLSRRLTPYTSAGGISLDQAEAPAGDYRIRIEIMDDGGHIGSRLLDLKVLR